MKITFVSNYINHHQIPLAQELYERLGDAYHFIETEQMEEERVAMGWNPDTGELPYLLRYYENPKACEALIEESDVVVFGGTDDESYIQPRLQAGKPVIRCSERLYKEGQWKAVSPRGLRKKYLDHTRYRKAPVYLLCAGAYVPCDFSIVRAYPGKMFCWGYFPPFVPKTPDTLFAQKEKNAVPKLLWSGRFLHWKHPLDAVWLAARLKQEGIPFELTMVGGGEEEELLGEAIQKEGLTEQIKLTGFLEPERVRQEMEAADVFLFTSDYREGWGAVLNEAMNSGCAVLANVAAGASPYLVSHGRNGLLYQNGQREQLLSHARYLLSNPDVSRRFGREAYETIAQTWNSRNAAEQLLILCRKLLGESGITLPEEGPGSPARVISQGSMYKTCVGRKGR